MPGRFSEIDLPGHFSRVAPAWVIQAAVGLLFCAASITLRAVLEQVVSGVAPFALLFPTLLIATLVAGWPAGAWTTLTGGAAAWYFLFEPQRSFALIQADDAVSLVLYVLAAAVIVGVADAYRRSARALEIERAQQALLINELNHRVKNTLATVQSVAAMTLGGRPGPEARANFEGRLFALSRAHDILTRNAWDSAELTELVAQALAPFDQPGRIEVEGPPVRFAPHQALGLSMALHELATNAVKYGALSTPAGHIRISWTVGGRTLSFRWQERGGPPVSAPKRRGFGSRLLEEGLARELDGHALLRFEPDGLICDLTARLRDGV